MKASGGFPGAFFDGGMQRVCGVLQRGCKGVLMGLQAPFEQFGDSVCGTSSGSVSDGGIGGEEGAVLRETDVCFEGVHGADLPVGTFAEERFGAFGAEEGPAVAFELTDTVTVSQRVNRECEGTCVFGADVDGAEGAGEPWGGDDDACGIAADFIADGGRCIFEVAGGGGTETVGGFVVGFGDVSDMASDESGHIGGGSGEDFGAGLGAEGFAEAVQRGDIQNNIHLLFTF